MRYVIAILMSATLLIHAVVGCSQHCETDCARCQVAPASTRSPASTCCHDHGGAEKRHSEHLPSTPCKCKLECKNYCISLPPERVSLDDSPAALPLAIVQASSHLPSLLASETALRLRVNVPPEREAPQRLHLAYQVLLI